MDSLPEDTDLENQLQNLFQTEQTLVSAGMKARIMSALPRPDTPTLKLARIFFGITLIGSLACLTVAAVMASHISGIWPTADVIRISIGSLTAIMALLLGLGTRSVATFDALILRRLTGRWLTANEDDFFLVRMGAVGLVVMAGIILL